MIYMFCGAPTAGKTTQSKLLGAAFNLPVISLGGELRMKAEHEPETARIMASGELVPSSMIEAILHDLRTRYDGNFIIDGIRLPAEVGYIRSFWPEQKVMAIELDVSADEIRRRAAVRRAESPTPRADDDPESVERRIMVFAENRTSLMQAFAENNVPVVAIDGDGSIENVHTKIMESLSHASTA